MKIIGNFKEFVKSMVFYKMPEPLFKNTGNLLEKQITKNINYRIGSFGDLNTDKIFYIIKRYPGAGLFSNFSFVLNHLKIADNLNFIPFVDMQTFPSWYNEKYIVNNTLNSWEYYFDQVSKFKLEEIYKSKYVIFSDKTYHKEFSKLIYEDQSLKSIAEKYIKINNNFIKESKEFIINNFKKEKVLGVYLRDGEFRSIPNHHLPPTKEQIITNVKKIFLQEKYDKIFLCSKELSHLKIFEKAFKDKFIIYNSFRSKEDCFNVYPRKNHRYLLGKEIIIEMLILSQLDGLIYSMSNVSQASIFFNMNPNQKRYFIDNGKNHSNRTIAKFYWFYKSILPEKFGGFKKNISITNEK